MEVPPPSENNIIVLALMCRRKFLLACRCVKNGVLELLTTVYGFRFRLGWAVCAAQRLRPQHGSISHPQKIPRFVAGVAKRTNTPAHIYWSLIRSYRSNQATAHPLKRRGTARFNIGSMVSTGPRRQLPNRSSPSLPAGGHAVTGSTHPQCKPQPTGARESPVWLLSDPDQRRVSPERPC